MLVINCRHGDRFRVLLPDGRAAWIQVTKHHKAPLARLLIDAPRDVQIDREAEVPAEERPCGKLIHRTRDRALARIAQLRADGLSRERPGLVLAPYVCQACNGAWHIGHRRDDSTAPAPGPGGPAREYRYRERPAS